VTAGEALEISVEVQSPLWLVPRTVAIASMDTELRAMTSAAGSPPRPRSAHRGACLHVSPAGLVPKQAMSSGHHLLRD